MVELVIAEGVHGANKLHVLRSPDPGVAGLVVFFVGDRLETFGLDPAISRLQDPAVLAELLSRKFPRHSVAVLVPSRMEAGCSCYDHFFQRLTQTGEPLGYHGAGFKASTQFQSLLHAAGLWPLPPPPGSHIHVVGFSKGGILLNQLLSEIAALQALEERADAGAGASASSGGDGGGGGSNVLLPPSAPLLRSLQQLHYLDAGLNCRGAYTTDPGVVEALGRWCGRHRGAPQLLLHGTPRQWDDPQRPFIAAEKNRMLAMCEAAGVPARSVKYFEGQRPSLRMHFAVIEEMEVPLCC